MVDCFFLFRILIVGAILFFERIVFEAFIILVNGIVFLSIWDSIWVEEIHVAFDFGEKEGSVLVVKDGDVRTEVTEDLLGFLKEDVKFVLLFVILHGFDEGKMGMQILKLFFELLWIGCRHLMKIIIYMNDSQS
jgi:hypothetical protein